jgi:hypothetical protein
MKKFIFSLLFLFTSIISFAQSSVYEHLTPTSINEVSEDNEYVQIFLENSNLINRYDGLSFDFEKIELLNVSNQNIKIISIPIKENDELNFIFGVINLEANDYMIFFQNFNVTETQVITKLFDEDKTEFANHTFNKNENSLNISLIDNYKPTSCFKSCMERQEDNFEDTFAGWIIWNTHPHVQIMAAINCKGCCKKWWNNRGC